MGQARRKGTRAIALALATALLTLTWALTAPAQAATPSHPRTPTLDLNGLNHACGVAVDSKGDLYAASAGAGKVLIFSPSDHETPIGEIANANDPCGLAVDSKGNLYVSEAKTGEVVRYKPTVYPFVGAPSYGPREVIDSSGQAKGIAVDPFDDRLYVAEGAHVSVYDPEGNLGSDEKQRVNCLGCTTGTYKLEFGGKATKPIAFEGPASEVKEALEELTSIGSGNVSVTNENVNDTRHFITFVGKLVRTDVEALKCLPEGINGSCNVSDEVKGFSGHIGEGNLTEATGVAPSTYKTNASQITYRLAVADASGDQVKLFSAKSFTEQQLRRTLSGPREGEEFGFGAKGAYLGSDQGTCPPSGAKACSAGHFFVYDDTHKVLDELEASGPLVSQTPFATGDGAPTAIAVDRSGGAGNGTLYATTGAGEGARALAFGALGAPSRSGPLEKPLSMVLAKACSVAIDDYGNRYVAVGPEVFVYPPNGEKLLAKITENAGSLCRVAVDSEGNLYALLKEKVAYFKPSSYPPKEGMTYGAAVTVAKQSEFGGNPIRAIAVNPANGHLFAISPKQGIEYKAAKEGSGVLNKEIGTGLGITTMFGVGVYGANGNIYITNSGGNGSVYLLDPKGKEIITQINGAGSPAGSLGTNAGAIAVDQSNGHVIAFETNHKDLEEYEASGTFVAAFGSFETLVTTDFGVAMDNGAFSPNKGDVYLAYDDPKATFDLSAFGGLGYADTKPLPKFLLTAKKTGTGTGKVTSTPSGIDCGSDCSEEYEEGTKVTLEAKADPGSEFKGWSGSGCSGTAACKVTMTEAREVSAEFATVVTPKFALKVKKAGSGTGTVTSSPAGINCGATCEAEFNEGTKVTLTGTSGANTKAVLWSGCGAVNGENKCEVTMSSAKEVTATFALEQHQLTVKKTGTGTGKVTSSPAGIDCGATCSASFDHGTELTLTATQDPGSEFKGWSGSGCSGTAACKVTMTEAREVSAEFATVVTPKFALKVKKAGSGTGTVTSSPAGINCGATCEAEFNEGTKVTLTGTSGANTKAVLWSGCGAVNGENKCEVTMSSAKEVTATFALEQHQLTVKKTGTGTGKVTSSPAGIDCGATCSASFDHGTELTLTATQDPGSEFKGWSGSGCSGTAACKVTMTEAREVSAEFATVVTPKFALKVKKAGSGTGTVTSSPAGINCGATCEAEFNEGTKVTLTGTSGANTKAVLWSGCGAVNGENKCEVTMSSAKEVTATFDEEPKGASFPLTVALEGTGSGTVTSDKGLISCNPFCSDEYEAGTKVVLTATAAPGSVFYSWKYCDSGGVNGRQCTVTVDKAKTVKATFITTHALEVSKAPGSGPGKVQSAPGGVLCLFNCSETSAAFREGTKVVVKQTPAKHFHFVEWLGDCSGSGACEVTMGEDHEVQAKFAEDAKHLLTLIKTGGGQGTVKSSVAGINCGVVCSKQASSYYQGEVVELIPTPGKGSAFKGWSGCDSEPEGKCLVTMSETHALEASFE